MHLVIENGYAYINNINVKKPLEIQMELLNRKLLSGAYNKSDRGLTHLEDHDQVGTGSNFWTKCFRKSVSSIVMMSYFSLTTIQTMAMDKVHPDSFVGTHKISVIADCDSYENQDNNTSVVELVEVNQGGVGARKSSGESQIGSNELSNVSATRRAERVVVISDETDESLSYKLEAFRVAFKEEEAPQTWKGKIYQLGNDIWKTCYLAGTFSVDSIMNGPANIANAGIWMEASARRLVDSDSEMPEEDGYYKRPMNFYRDDEYYGGQKDKYMQCLISTALFGTIIYHSTMAESNVAVYTGFDVLANIPYFYEQFFYNHGDDRYYYLDRVKLASLVFTWTTLPFFTRYQCNAFGKNIWATKEEARLYENFGFYSEALLNTFVTCSAVAAGLFLAWDYYVAVSRLKGTEQVSDDDFDLYPAFLAASFAITMFNIKMRTTKDQYRDFSRWSYGDKAGFERGIVSDAIEFYDDSVKEKFKEKPRDSKVQPEEILNNVESAPISEDIEAQINSAESNKVKTVLGSVSSALELEEGLSKFSGTELFQEVLNHWSNHKPKIERKEHDLEAIQKLREEHDAPLSTKFFRGTQKATKWALNNSYWIIPMLICLPVAYVSYGSFVSNAQLALPQDPDSIYKMDETLSYKAQLSILKKYEGRILADPVKWQTRCLKHMNVLQTVTDDENFYAYYYAEANNQTADYILHFTTPYCLGIQPGGVWIFGPGPLSLNYDNAVSLFSGWKGILTAYSEVDISPPTLTKATKNTAHVGGGFYTAGVYALSVLSLGPIFNSLADSKVSLVNKMIGIFLSIPAFVQGMYKAAPQGIEAFMDLNSNFQNDFGSDGSTTMGVTLSWAALVAGVTALTLIPDFYTVQSENLEWVKEKIYGRNSLNHLNKGFDIMKRLVDTSKASVLKDFYRKYAK